MITLTDAPLKFAPLISGSQYYAIHFPVVGVGHILELCCKDHLADWPAGAHVEIGFLAFDHHGLNATGDYDRSAFQTFVPMFDYGSSPLHVKKNCGIPIAPPRSGVTVLRAVNMPDCYVSMHPVQELRQQSVVWLPSLQQ